MSSSSRVHNLRKTISELYLGRSRRSTWFRYGLLTFDCATIAFFIVASILPFSLGLFIADFVIAAALILDYLARLWIARRKTQFVFQILNIADVIVIATLLAPTFIENFAFLRVLRALRLLRSYHVLWDLRRRYPFFARNEELIGSILNLVVFIFVMTAIVFVIEAERNPKINNYVDALYFTVTTLTTTGFGDITLEGSAGRLLAVLIMVIGVALFLRLVQTIFRPQKVRYECEQCGLNLHDPDAVHCKHCGHIVHIDTEGE
ncbi:MAG: ion transporter [Hyphomicrobiales bacterium]|nr:ion transporter [Hyphomicrobiales bacterium]